VGLVSPVLCSPLSLFYLLFILLGPIKEPVLQGVICVYVEILKLLFPNIPLPNLVSCCTRLPHRAVLVTELIQVVDTLIQIDGFGWCWKGMVLAGIFWCPANVTGKCKCTKLAGGVLAVEVGDGVTTVIGEHWVVTILEEPKDVLGVGVLGGGDSNGNGGCEQH